METMSIVQVARDAIQVQDACNLSGVARSFVRAIDAIRAHDPKGGNPQWDTHPIAYLFAYKLLALAGAEPISQFDRYSSAISMCEEIIRAELETALPIPWIGEGPKPLPTLAQVKAFGDLVDRSGTARETVLRASRWELIGWKPGESCTLLVPLHGMLAGIEPDGYTHT